MSFEKTTLGEYATVQGGYAYKSQDFVADGRHAVLKIKNIRQGFVDYTNPSYVLDKIAFSTSKWGTEAGDILISMTGSGPSAPESLVGRVARVWKGEPKALINQRVGRLHLKHERKIDKDFLFYVLSQKGTQDFLVANSTGSANQVNINSKTIELVECPRVDFHVSQRIAVFLNTLEERLRLLHETSATLEAIAQALFKSWFVDFDPVRAKLEGRAPEGMDEATAALFPDGFEETELGLVPTGWQGSRVGCIASVIDCLHSKKPELLDIGRPYLQLNNIRDDGLLDTSALANISDNDYERWTSRIEVCGGDCVITNVGRVGAVAQIPDGFKAAMGRNMTAIRPRTDWPYPTYLIELLQSPWMRTEIDAKTDVGTILNALNVKSIPLLRCVVAPHIVMQRFEEVSRPLRASMEANMRVIQSLSSLRDALLPRLISGQLRLTETVEKLEAA